jgi:chromosomal replication initiation ATPase DnaA
MNYAIARHNYITQPHICISDKKQYITTDDMRITLVLSLYGNGTKSPDKMLEVIAAASHMQYDYFKTKTRKREIVELRFMAALLLRKYYPNITLKEIARLYGGQDHTSVMNGLARANELLDINDPVFTYKYQNAVYAINRWIKE